MPSNVQYAAPYSSRDDSYFHQPGSHGYYPSSSTSHSQFQSGNIDDIIYRASAELDRGTPTVGIYSQDGLWEEEEVRHHSVFPAVSAAPSIPPVVEGRGESTKATSTRGRKGTVSSVSIKPEEKPKMFGSWSKRHVHPIPVEPFPLSTASYAGKENISESKEKILKKAKSWSKLRGKGRRGELSVDVGDADESFEAPPPLPTTPSSFLTQSSSPALSTATYLSPFSYPSRVDLHLEASLAATTMGKTKGSSWKRGMEKIFRSKSSTALRDAFAKENSEPPPLPPAKTYDNLPRPSYRPSGKPFSASTPPMALGGSQRTNILNTTSDHLSPLPSVTTDSFQLPTLSNLPHDPFASTLDMFANNVPTTPSSLNSPKLGSPLQPTRPKMQKNSPSLRDLRSFLPNKPKLSATKSMANLSGRNSLLHPASAPANQTEFFPSSKLVKRMSSMVGLSTQASDMTARLPMPELGAPLRRPILARMPTESPPLLPPNPPYFPTTSSMSLRSSLSSGRGSSSSSGPGLEIDTSLTASASASSSWTPPPTSPLPPLPSSASTTQPLNLHRSASGAVLLPRSRSTSMSLKAPPTSSSFFDLYEQLGIWPTPEKDKGMKTQTEGDIGEESASNNSTSSETDNGCPLLVAPTISESPSATFSNSSWEAAISAFPMVDDNQSRKPAFDFGLPSVRDEAPNPFEASFADEGVSDVLSNMVVAASCPSSSKITGLGSSTSSNPSGDTAHPAGNAAASSSGLSGSMRMSQGQSGSGNSSRESSCSRRPSGNKRSTNELVARKISSDSSESESEPDIDDVPLSQLHPEAAAMQRSKTERRQARAANRAARAINMQRERVADLKILGRNPGGGTGWNGEGGVPADVLRSKLETLSSSCRRGRSTVEQSVSISTDMSRRQMHAEHFPPTNLAPRHSLRPQRSFTNPAPTRRREAESVLVQRSSTVHRSSASQHQDGVHKPPTSVLTPPMPNGSLLPSPVIQQGPISPSRYTFDRNPSSHAPHIGSAPMQAGRSSSSRSGPSRGPSMAGSSSHDHGRFPLTPADSHHPHQRDRSGEVSRSSTDATQRSNHSKHGERNRAYSNAASLRSQQPVSEQPNARSTTEPRPPQQRNEVVHVDAFLNVTHGKSLVIEVWAETTARDVLVSALARREIGGGEPGIGWVLVEVFAELGWERQVREYEPLLPIIKGWDATARSNCFLFRQSGSAFSTLIRGIPSNSPFFGTWVQAATKKGKWAKRWLETRGGQVFLARNEKNKDEIQINTSFFDVYTVTRSHSAPKSFVFAMKIKEPASAFENPDDYMHMFAAEQATGGKILSALYDAKSWTIGQSKPGLTVGAPSVPSRANQGRSAREADGPLVDLQVAKKADMSGFTGKGLLKC